ncbi:serpin B4-like [Eurosta solidaginis]|uniref:serpin B4-like n=1 Tax=Eurosta solidaginis TaxID=178769 RepID=UPI0035309827
MSRKCVYAYFAFNPLFCLKLNFALVFAKTSAAENVATNVTECRIDLMHEMLARILASADASSNFLIAPQEALKLYLQLHEEEIAADEVSTLHNDQSKHVKSNDLNTDNNNNVECNEVDVGGINEFEEFFHITGSPICVSNTLYANVYTANRFTRKLKNLKFVMHEENAEDDKSSCGSSTACSNNNNHSESGNEGKNIDNNKTAIANNAKNGMHNTNNNSQHNHSHNHIKNNKTRNELINVVRINSRWAHNFQKHDTHKRQFHMPQIHTHFYLNAMRKYEIFPYAYLKRLNASALELSLERAQLKMLIILPHAKDGLRHLLQRLSANVTLLDELCGMKLDMTQETGITGTVDSQCPHLDSTLVKVFLLKFQFTQRTVLGEVFQQLLNVTANVDLHWRSPWQVIQEIHFAVNEDGIGELKPSVVLFWNAFSSLRTKPLMFCVDHPFMSIVHNRQGIQLLGHLAQQHE